MDLQGKAMNKKRGINHIRSYGVLFLLYLLPDMSLGYLFICILYKYPFGIGIISYLFLFYSSSRRGWKQSIKGELTWVFYRFT